MPIPKLDLAKPFIECTPSEFTAAARRLYRESGKKIPKGELTVKTLIKTEPDSFTKEGKLTEIGRKKVIECINDFQLPENATVAQVIEAAKIKKQEIAASLKDGFDKIKDGFDKSVKDVVANFKQKA